jgi:hypothetical protein
MIIWTLLRPGMTYEHLGLLVYMLDDRNPKPAAEQLDAGYRHGGGWRPFKGHKLTDNDGLSYPGDPVEYPVAETWLRDEHILLYPHDWVAIIQPDRSFEVCRMD